MKNITYILVTALLASCGSSKYYFNKRLNGTIGPPEIIAPEVIPEQKLPPDTLQGFSDETMTYQEKMMDADTTEKKAAPVIATVELKHENNAAGIETQKQSPETTKYKKQKSEKSNGKGIIILIVVIIITLIAIIAIRAVMVNLFIAALSSI